MKNETKSENDLRAEEKTKVKVEGIISEQEKAAQQLGEQAKKEDAAISTLASKPIKLRKLILSAILAGLAYVLSSFVYFPAMAPFQHFVNVIAAVLVGPWYAMASAFLCGFLRMTINGRTIQAVAGAIFGPIIAGFLYKKTKNLYLAFIGEVVGTGIVGALASYPLMKIFYGLETTSFIYYIPYYTPSALMGAGMGLAVLLMFRRNGILKNMKRKLDK